MKRTWCHVLTTYKNCTGFSGADVAIRCHRRLCMIMTHKNIRLYDLFHSKRIQSYPISDISEHSLLWPMNSKFFEINGSPSKCKWLRWAKKGVEQKQWANWVQITCTLTPDKNVRYGYAQTVYGTVRARIEFLFAKKSFIETKSIEK